MPKYNWHCVFCGAHWEEYPQTCKSCRNYKGLVECNPACEFGETYGEWVPANPEQLYNDIEGCTIVRVEEFDDNTIRVFIKTTRETYCHVLIPKPKPPLLFYKYKDPK